MAIIRPSTQTLFIALTSFDEIHCTGLSEEILGPIFIPHDEHALQGPGSSKIYLKSRALPPPFFHFPNSTTAVAEKAQQSVSHHASLTPDRRQAGILTEVNLKLIFLRSMEFVRTIWERGNLIYICRELSQRRRDTSHIWRWDRFNCTEIRLLFIVFRLQSSSK